MIVRKNKGNNCVEQGSSTFFVIACLLPFLFLLLTLSLDIGIYLKTLRNINQTLDDAAFYAYRYMPDTEAVEKNISLYLTIHSPNIVKDVDIKFDNLGIILNYFGSSKVTFAKIFNIDFKIPLQVVSKVRATNYDVLIVMDVGSYMAPKSDSDYWTNDSQSSDPTPWYAAKMFESLSLQQNNQNPLALTQRCFNPAINPVKVTALALVDYFTKSPLNSVGALVYPSADIRESFLVSPVVPAGNFQITWNRTADFQKYCVAIAEEESQNPRYAFPKIDSNNLANDDIEKKLIYENGFQFNSVYNPTISDILWTYPVQKKTPNFANLLSTIRKHIITSDVVLARGGLTGRVQKSVFIIAGDLPWQEGVRYPADSIRMRIDNELEKIKEDVFRYELDLKMYYVFWRHLGQDELSSSDVEKLSQDFLAYSFQTGKSSLDVKVIFADSYDEFIQSRLLDGLILDQRNMIISK